VRTYTVSVLLSTTRNGAGAVTRPAASARAECQKPRRRRNITRACRARRSGPIGIAAWYRPADAPVFSSIGSQAVAPSTFTSAETPGVPLTWV